MMKPHHKPCFVMFLLFGLGVYLAWNGYEAGAWIVWFFGLCFGLLAISKYPDDKEWESE